MVGGLRLQVKAYYSRSLSTNQKELDHVTIILKTKTSGPWVCWNYAGFGEAGPLVDVTQELGPESFDGNASFMHLSRNKSVEEVVNILKRHGFFKESLKIDNAADFRNLNSGPEIVIEMYKP